MKCSQCSTELPGTTTICPQCGSSTYERQAATFSYLPPDAPPWPTRVPAQLPAMAEAAVYPPATFHRPPGNDTKANQQRRGKIGIIAVLVLTPLIGALATFAFLYSHGQLSTNTNQTRPPDTSTQPTAAPQEQNNSLPDPTSFKIVKDGKLNVSVQYPADWSASPPQMADSSASLSITQKEMGIAFSIAHLATAVTGQIASAEALNQANIQQLSKVQDFHQVEEVEANNARPTIAGEQWVQKEATILDGQNNKLHFTTISDKHSQSYYVIYFIVPDSIYQAALTKYLTPMLNSVHFLS